jgi:hypothetical protein
MRPIATIAPIVFAAVAVIAAGASAQSPSAASSGPQSTGGLVPLPDAKVKFAKVRPGTDWAKYHTIELATLRVPAEVRDAAPKGARPGFGESYVLRDQDVTALQDAYAGAMRDELGKAGFTFVTTPGPDTLIVLGQILNIQLTAPIESTRRNYAGGATFSRDAGTMVMGLVFGDGATGQLIAEAADQSMSDNVWGMNNRTTNLGEARIAFRRWARAIRERLVNARGS